MSRSDFIAVTFVVFIVSYVGYTSADWPECKTYKNSGITEFRCFGVKGLRSLNNASKTVNSISIQSSTISNIPANAFRGFRSTLKYLDLNRDGIQTIASEAFSGLTRLKNLTLWGNRLTRVEAAWFTNLGQLKSLDLSFNSITVIEESIFRNMTNLVSLYIDSNEIHGMDPVGFAYLVSLRRARIGRNPWHWWSRATVTRQLDNQHVDYSSEWDNYDWINHIVWTCMEKHKANENDDSVLDCASEYFLQEHSLADTIIQRATTNCVSEARALYTCSARPYPGQNATEKVTPKVALRRILQGFIGTFQPMQNPDSLLLYRTF